jgi:OmcA/MtrC family decaheme c-type cytochrome
VKRPLILLFILSLCVPVLFLGCTGDTGSKGSAGATGDTGPQGPQGPPGAGVTTNESCVICHGAGAIADVAVFMPQSTDNTLAMDSPDLTNTGGFGVITFHLKRASDNASVTTLTASQVRVYMADLVPAGTAGNSESSDYFHRWAYERSTAATDNSYVAWTNFTNAGAGNYSITMSTPLANADNAADVQRLYVRISGLTGYGPFAGILDFVIPADGFTATTADLPQYQKAYVTVQTCQKCHGNPMQGVAHGGNYADTRVCVLCHSPLYEDPENPALPAVINASRFYHQIHAAIEIPEFSAANGNAPYTINGVERSYDAVTFPQEVKNCVLCHSDPDGLTTGSAAAIDNWKDHPTITACTSCHNVTFGASATHSGGTQVDADCHVCHPASGTGYGQSVTTAHAIVPAAADVPEFNVTISLTPPANGTHYVADEAPLVTVTLKNYADNTAVDSSRYGPMEAAGVAGGGLSVANLYVYGPRAKAVPVLTTNSTTDPAWKGNTTYQDNTATRPTQSHSLFVGGTDPLVETDSTGFKYQLLTIPAGMTAGTYLIHFDGGDYGAKSATDYKTSSNKTITFRIGTATDTEKVAGDGCVNCHGATRMHAGDGSHGLPHDVPFNTDDCLACHDQSGNTAIPIANRVHAIHDANPYGDLYNVFRKSINSSRDWSDITYPQDTERCITCHTSKNTTFQTNPFTMPCAGCHVEAGTVTLDHMRQNGSPW